MPSLVAESQSCSNGSDHVVDHARAEFHGMEFDEWPRGFDEVPPTVQPP
jgi:hypothetical protein